MVLWVIDEHGASHRLVDRYAATWYLGGDSHTLKRAEIFCRSLSAQLTTSWTTRMDLYSGDWPTVLAIAVTDLPRFTHIVHQLTDAFPKLSPYTCDIALPQLYLYETGLFPLAKAEFEVNDDGLLRAFHIKDSPWDLEYALPPLRFMTIRSESTGPSGRNRSGALTIQVGQTTHALEAENPRELLGSLNRWLEREDPDVLLTDFGDAHLFPMLSRLADQLGTTIRWHKDGAGTPIAKKERSFFTYGKIVHQAGPQYLRGRWHLDRQNSFMLRECRLAGLLEVARLTKIPVQQACRATIGTGISSMQLDTAVQNRILVPWKKQRPEMFKSGWELLATDKGGLVFQPDTGYHEMVGELDFASMYPSIMVSRNLSAETMKCTCCATDRDNRVPETEAWVCTKREGLIPKTLRPLVEKRLKYKILKRTHPDPETRRTFADRYGAHKWMLVCCFGYLGYKNARFGCIEAHEATNAYGREALLRAKETAEAEGFHLLHAIVDSLWLKKTDATPEDYQALAASIEQATGLPMSFEGIFGWIGFFPSRSQPLKSVANRYAGAYLNGELKVRGLEVRRHDTPPFIKRVQQQMLDAMKEAKSLKELAASTHRLEVIAQEAIDTLNEGRVPLEELVITKHTSKSAKEYTQASATAVVVHTYHHYGIVIRPGQRVRYVVTDANAKRPADRYCPFPWLGTPPGYDAEYYADLVRRAFSTLAMKPSSLYH